MLIELFGIKTKIFGGCLMRVLWIVNIVFPEVSDVANVRVGYGGGWMTAMAERLRKRNDIELAVSVKGKVNKIIKKRLIT